MAIIDFCEIPEANLASGEQDRFEFFVRDFLEYLKYDILEGPSRGPDRGRDLIVEDLRKGVSGSTVVRWLVSCKHKAHSGKAVSVNEEPSVLDRVRAHKCQGFLGAYSTLPSSALVDRLTVLRQEVETKWLDNEQIEKELLRSSRGLYLARRYFPKSLNSWQKENPLPPRLFDAMEPLLCDYCGTVLLDPNRPTTRRRTSVITFWVRKNPGQQIAYDAPIVDIHWSCKGDCDRAIERKAVAVGLMSRGWEDITDVCIPFLYLRWIMVCINQLRDGRLGHEAIEKLKTFMLVAFHFVSRASTDQEDQRVDGLRQIPSFLGGLGKP